MIRYTRLTKLQILNMNIRVWERTHEMVLGPNPLLAAQLMEHVHEPDETGCRLTIGAITAAFEATGTVTSFEVTTTTGNGVIVDIVK